MSSAETRSPAEDVSEAAVFGQRLRHLRQAAGLTLKELGERAGLAISTISKIENDRMSPTYDVLLRLAGGLAIDLSSLLEGPAPTTVQASGRLDVTRASERRKHPTGTYIYEPFATGLTRKGMDPTLVRVTARSIAEFPDLIRHPGEELVFVISGTVELHAEFYAPIRLEAGDSVYYDATMGHAYISVGPEDATILNICCGTGGVPPVELPGADR